MNKLLLTLASVCIISLANCTKENTPGNNIVGAFPDKNILGRYTGIITSKCDYIPAIQGQGSAFSETTPNNKTVIITNDSFNYLLDGNIMQGGPTIYSFQGYVLNAKSYTIDFSASSSGQKLVKIGNTNHKYNFNCFTAGQLVHE